MLTTEQLAMRENGVGASEAGAVLGLNPFKGPLDVWVTKRTPTRAPLVAPSEDGDSPRAEVGHAIESGLRNLFTKRTGVRIEPSGTLRHDAHPFVLVTPDGLAVDEDAGLELKLVGSHMAPQWGTDGEYVPDYVTAQVAIGMAVTGRSRWYIGALLGGTDFRIYQVTRDVDLELAMLEGIAHFWNHNVMGDVPPEPTDEAERRAFLLTRYPGNQATKCRDESRNGDLATAIAWLTEVKRQRAVMKEAEESLTNTICELTGSDRGVVGSWGKFTWAPSRGHVSWKDVAEELAHGAVPVDVIERHRGASLRVPRLLLKQRSE